MRRHLLLAGLVLLAGCGPALVWHGHAPTRTFEVAVYEDHRGQYVSVDGERDGHYDGIGLSGIAFARRGERFAYPARLGFRWVVVVDGRPGPPWDGVGTVAFTPDGSRLVYTAVDDGRWHVVVDHVAGPPFDAILSGSLALASNGRVAYAVVDRGKVRVVVDTSVSEPHDGVAALQFSPSGDHVAYVSRVGDDVRLVVDGKPSPPTEAIAEVAWPPPSDPRPGYLARWGKGWHAVIGSDTLGPFEAVGSLSFRPDGAWAVVARDRTGDRVITSRGEGLRHPTVLPRTLVAGAGRWAYVIRTEHGERVVVDGSSGPVFNKIRDLQFGPDGRRLGYIGELTDSHRVVVEGQPPWSYPVVSELVVGSRCGPTVFVVPDPEGDRIVVDGDDRVYGRAVAGSLVIGNAGLHWGALAGDVDKGLWYLIDGEPRAGPFDWDEFAAAITADTTGSLDDQIPRLLESWVSGELELWRERGIDTEGDCAGSPAR